MSIKYEKAYIIAEVAQTHEGSLGNAIAFINAAKSHGADAVKFQIHFAEYESSSEDTFRPGTNFYDDSRFDYWKRIEFTENQWIKLRNYAKKIKIDFIVSVFSVEAFELATKLDIDYLKIGSGEIYNKILLSMVKEVNLPLMLSFGMASKSEIEKIIETFQGYSNDIVLFQCTTKYPSDFKDIGINVIQDLRAIYNESKFRYGLSDHSGSIYPSLAAYTVGASFFEVHFTLSKLAFGPDVSSSLEPEEFSKLRDALDKFHIIFNNPVNKDKLATELLATKTSFGKSIYYSKSMKAGDTIKISDLLFLKPNNGVDNSKADEIIGKRLKVNVSQRTKFKFEDIEE
jgi:N,N'-diacetyllegionaminate synthase